jgi:hypothetical protein
MQRLLFSFAAVLLSMACAAQQPAVDLEGTLIRQNGRTVLRVGDDIYTLRFPSTSLMTFTNDLLGEDVRVRGTLQLRTENGQQRAVVTPERIDRLGVASVPTEETAIDTSVSDVSVVEPQAQPVTRVNRRKALVRDVGDDAERPTAFQDRVDRRKRGIRRNDRRYNYDYNETIITPGGGVIINNR